jgi:predicted MPP superfamily phosphohydrolase
MRIAIVHLSDINFRVKGNPLALKAQQLASAISSSDAGATLFLIVISGDIAFSAHPDEYSIAAQFFSDVMTKLKASSTGC